MHERTAAGARAFHEARIAFWGRMAQGGAYEAAAHECMAESRSALAAIGDAGHASAADGDADGERGPYCAECGNDERGMLACEHTPANGAVFRCRVCQHVFLHDRGER